MLVRPAFPRALSMGQPRRGLTLIELVVVLTILIALAGLLIPMLPSMLTRAHTSTCSTNMGEVTKAILTYQELYSTNPNGWDALSDGTNMINYFANGQACPAQYQDPGTPSGSSGGNGELTGSTPTAAELAALNAVGITQVNLMVATPATTPGTGAFDPTFSYYVSATTTPTTITTTTTLAFLDPTTSTTSTAYARCIALNLPVTGRYVVLGVGPRNSMVGKTIQTPPVHFGDQPVLNPEYGYQRLVAIYKVSDTAIPTGSFTQAVYVGCAPVHDTGLGSIQDELQNWYQLTVGGS